SVAMARGAHRDRPSATVAFVGLASLLSTRADPARLIGRTRVDPAERGNGTGRPGGPDPADVLTGPLNVVHGLPAPCRRSPRRRRSRHELHCGRPGPAGPRQPPTPAAKPRAHALHIRTHRLAELVIVQARQRKLTDWHGVLTQGAKGSAGKIGSQR